MEMKKKSKKRKEQKRKSMQLKLFFSLNISPCLGQKQFFSRKENTYSENKVFSHRIILCKGILYHKNCYLSFVLLLVLQLILPTRA